MKCENCNAGFDILIQFEGEKATEPLIEFCPVCSLTFETE